MHKTPPKRPKRKGIRKKKVAPKNSIPKKKVPKNKSTEAKGTATSDKYTEIGEPTPRTGYVPNELEQLLNIKWSKYIPHVPTPKQLAALMLVNHKELLFGGALGGGKSDFLAYEAIRFCDIPGFSSIIFRRRLTDLKQPGSLIPRIAEWLGPFKEKGDCRYIDSEHKWEFKTTYPGTDIKGPPAMLQFGYIGEAQVRERYQSAEYQLVAFDELGQWESPMDYLFMNSRIRATVCKIHGKDKNGDPIWNDNCHICAAKRIIPLRLRAASNPGPAWIKRHFSIVPDPSIYKTRQQALIAIQEGEKIRWVGTHPERKFIPSYLEDNPHLATKEYQTMLKEMTDEERSRLEDGNWEARKDSRFKRRWVQGRYFNLYSDGYCFLDEMMRTTDTLPFSTFRLIFTTVDSASTSKLFTSKEDDAIAAADQKEIKKPSSSCIATWGVTHEEQLLWLDLRKFRKEIPDIIEELVDVNNIWRPQYNKIEVNGVGISVAQFAHMSGLPVRKNTRRKDKLENSLSAQVMMKNGQIYFPANTSWIESAEDDVFGWTGLPKEEDDVIDVVADAAYEITPRMARKILQPTTQRPMPKAISMTQSSGVIPHYGLTQAPPPPY